MSALAVGRARSWLGYESPEITARWELRDVLTYALAVGADPEHDPAYLDEAAGPRMLPTFATFAAGPWVPHLHRTIWAEQPGAVAASLAYRVHRPVPVAGQAATRVRVTGYEVKPSALLVWLTTTTAGPGGPLLSGRHCVLFRGGGDRQAVGQTGPWPDPHPSRGPSPVGGDAWLTAAVRIDPRAIPLYRLLLPLVAGEPGPDPLHADGSASASAGLGPPTLHGVAVLGHVGLALSRMLGGRIGGVTGFGARFRRPVHPGDTLAVSAGPSGPGAAWALRATDEAGQDVLDQAWIEIIEESP
ncbi:MAG: MaoC/PaaZ C-terminal domain-containing protein [Trebonia sp.]|jgi:acyl dehydratase